MTALRRILRTASAGRRRPDHQPVTQEQEHGAGRPQAGFYFGMTRFSLFDPSNRSWRLSRRADWSDPPDYGEHLFSAERMAPRCEIFCDLAAPVYQQMAGKHHYRHLVAYSPELPSPWLDRLRAAAERYPVLWLVQSPGGNPDLKVQIEEHLSRHSEGDALVYAFRVDDDDLLPTDYLDQVRPYLIPEHQGWAISFTGGYAALYENGRYMRLSTFNDYLSSMGQGAFGSWSGDEQSLALSLVTSHRRTDQRRTVIADGKQPMFLQTRHVGQDTALRESEPLDRARARRNVIKELDKLRPVSDIEKIYGRFPTLRGRVD